MDEVRRLRRRLHRARARLCIKGKGKASDFDAKTRKQIIKRKHPGELDDWSKDTGQYYYYPRPHL
jgi:hypothetical protein